MRLATLVLLILHGAAQRSGAADRPWRFTDVSEQAGLKPHLASALNHAVAWGDFNADGKPDLFLGNFDKGDGVPNGLFHQLPSGRFAHLPMPSVDRRGRTSGAVLADLDNDGDLDLYVSNNTHPAAKPGARPSMTEPSRLYRNDAGVFIDIGKESGACPPEAAFGRDVGILDFDDDGLLDLLVLEDKVFRTSARSRLYRNTGNMKFEDVTERAGLPADLHGFGVALADLNDDRRLDLFICGPNRLYLSEGKDRYREAQHLRPVLEFKGKDAEDYVTGASFGDLGGDGRIDLITGVHHIPARVRVFMNRSKSGAVSFADVTTDLNIPELPQKAPNCQIADFDQDGLADLYWSAWFAEGAKRQPLICRGLGVKDGLPRFDLPPLPPVNATHAKRNQAPPDGSRGMLYYVNGPAIDYDADGDLDFFAGIWPEESSRLFRNDTPAAGNWLTVSVQGRRMNRMGIGARVRVTTPGLPAQVQDLTMNGGYSGSRPPVAHFGLGPATQADVEVHFPTQSKPLLLKGVPANRPLVVPEP